MTRSLPLRVLATALVLVSLACSSTSFVTTWTAPDAQPLRLAGSKVVAVFMGRNPAVRRSAEDAMAREITKRGAQGVPSYTVIPDGRVRDEDFARSTFERMGFQGSVVMRVVGHETQYSYTPSYWSTYPYYRSYWGGYWGWGWSSVYQPGYLTAEKVVSVETLVYSFRQNKLLFAGVSRTVDPSSVDSLIAELSSSVTDEMKKGGLL